MLTMKWFSLLMGSLFMVLMFGNVDSNSCHAQSSDEFEGDTTSLEYLLYLFKVDKNKGMRYNYLKPMYKNRIPTILVKKFLKRKPAKGHEKGYYSRKIAISNNHYYALIYDMPCHQRDMCRTSYLSIIDKQGDHLANTIFGYDSVTRYTMDTMRSRLIQQRLLEKVRNLVRYERGAAKHEVIDTVITTYKYYELSDSGKLTRVKNLENSPNREFHWSSRRLVQPFELEEFTTRELNILKNEIFADYGFKFHADRWREYFGKKEWYEPTSSNVNDKLNVIELYNIKRIIKFQRRKE